jgi:RNA polymerase sigma factor (sigma-70 family)
MSPRISIRLLAAQSDQRLVALAREGHERAFEALVHRYRRPLLRYARRMRLSEARAEDVLQQALMQAWIALSRGAAVHDVRSWLYRIVHNVTVNAMRGPAGEAHGELTQAVQDRAGLAGVSNLERTIAMHDALSDVAALPRMQQQAIFLTAVDGQSPDEVAGVLGISEGALRGLLYRARSSLRSAAAALTPPPILAWASAGAGSGGPTAERLTELSSGGAAGMAGLLLKGAVVAVTAGAVATGANVLSVHHRGARPHPSHTQATQVASDVPAASAVAFAFASDPQIARELAGTHGLGARHGHTGSGRHERRGSSREAHLRGGGSGERRGGEPAEGGRDDLLVFDDGGGRRSSRSAGRDRSGSGDAGSGSGSGSRSRGSSSGGASSGDGQGSGSRSGSGQGGSSHDGSSQRDPHSSDASLADSSGSLPDSTAATATAQPSGAQSPSVVSADDELAIASGDRPSGKSGKSGGED